MHFFSLINIITIFDYNTYDNTETGMSQVGALLKAQKALEILNLITGFVYEKSEKSHRDKKPFGLKRFFPKENHLKKNKMVPLVRLSKKTVHFTFQHPCSGFNITFDGKC